MNQLRDVLDELADTADAPDLAPGAWRRAQQQRRRAAGFLIAGTAAAVLVVVLVGANALSGHPGGGAPVGPATGPTPAAAARTTPQPSPLSALPTPPASRDAGSFRVNAEGQVTFHSPSGNITCALSSSAAQCTLDQHWPLTAKQERSCEPAALEGADLQAGLPARFLCATDVLVPGRSAALSYGRSVSHGRFTCTSATTGMTCRDRESGHGFTISREGYSFS
jgi:hypothetical protein